MALVEGCKHRLEITVPVEDVETETGRIIESLKQKVKLPGFRPGKVPASMLKARYASEIRKELVEALVPRYLRKSLEDEGLDLVGTPNVTDLKYKTGEPLEFTVEFEVTPEIELGEYRGIEIPYEAVEVTDEDLDRRLDELREQKAEYLNVDPRPIADGDYAVVSLKSLAGVDGEPIQSDEMMLHIGDKETLRDFSENLLGMEPGHEKEIDVTYPEDYGQERLAGKTVRFLVGLKAIRQKELPELDDDFAQDLGDFKDLAELKTTLHNTMSTERELVAQQEAKNALLEKLVEAHDFPVPDTYVDRQIEVAIEARMREVVAQGVDPRSLKVDWDEVRKAQRERAIFEVKASLILGKVAELESIEVMQDEVDQQVQRIAQQRREAPVTVRKELEEAGEIARIASRLRSEKTLNLLFEQSRKVARDAKAPEK